MIGNILMRSTRISPNIFLSIRFGCNDNTKITIIFYHTKYTYKKSEDPNPIRIKNLFFLFEIPSTKEYNAEQRD